MEDPNPSTKAESENEETRTRYDSEDNNYDCLDNEERDIIMSIQVLLIHDRIVKSRQELERLLEEPKRQKKRGHSCVVM
jgi:hypothetical protein